MATVVDRLASTTPITPLGEPASAYYAQTFKAAGSRLSSVEFLIDTVGYSAGPTQFRLLVTTVNVVGGEVNPVAVLFESQVFADAADSPDSFALIKVSTNGLALVPGQTYAFILDAFVTRDGVESVAQVGLSSVPYADGVFAYRNLVPNGTTRADHFASDWTEYAGDLAFRLTFNEPGVTIVGTKGRDIVDAAKAPKGQSPAGENNDTITGLGGKDNLSGLGGDDLLDGGKDKDTLTGGDGGDQFRFSAGLKKNPPDKIVDFNPVDDILLLAVAKFKALTPGALSDDAFRDIGEANSDAVLVIYKANGNLQYDKDGRGGSDPVTFAKLVGAPDLSAADVLAA